tara:strand:+ start:561 stop:965 length:405 start_codon:yes stop_codon:yes gene_type:complete
MATRKNTKKTKKSTETSKTPKKKRNIKSMSQAHGKQETTEPTTLDQIWGDTGLTKYNTLDEKEYINSLDDMTKSELQAHATKVGLIPVDNRETLKTRLLREFNKHTSSYKKPSMKASKKVKLSPEIKKILSEGK